MTVRRRAVLATGFFAPRLTTPPPAKRRGEHLQRQKIANRVLILGPRQTSEGFGTARIGMSRSAAKGAIDCTSSRLLPLPSIPWLANADGDVEYYRVYGRIRQQPLRPTNRPLSILRELEATRQWNYRKRTINDQTMIAAQLIRLVSSAEVDLDTDWPAHDLIVNNKWDSYVQAFEQRTVHWDDRAHRYVEHENSRAKDEHVWPWCVGILVMLIGLGIAKWQITRRHDTLP